MRTRQNMHMIPDCPAITARFWKRVHRTDTCWIWRGGKDRDGYGYMTYKYKRYTATRISYFLNTSQQPLTNIVCHSCDNPTCVNPSHLFLGTDQTNAQDRVAKGRGCKLTWDIVNSVRYDFNNTCLTVPQLTLKYNFNVSQVVYNLAWHDPDYIPKVRYGVKKYTPKRFKLSDIYHNIQHVAKLVKCSYAAIYHWIKKDRIPYLKIGKRYYFTNEHIEVIKQLGRISIDWNDRPTNADLMYYI